MRVRGAECKKGSLQVGRGCGVLSPGEGLGSGGESTLGQVGCVFVENGMEG